jgi:hypothetical protein
MALTERGFAAPRCNPWARILLNEFNEKEG